MEGGRPSSSNSVHEKRKSEILLNFRAEIGKFEPRLRRQRIECPNMPHTCITAQHLDSLQTCLTADNKCPRLPADWIVAKNGRISTLHHALARSTASQTYPILYCITPQLTLGYDSRNSHGSQFLHEIERSTEVSKNALLGPPPTNMDKSTLVLGEHFCL